MIFKAIKDWYKALTEKTTLEEANAAPYKLETSVVSTVQAAPVEVVTATLVEEPKVAVTEVAKPVAAMSVAPKTKRSPKAKVPAKPRAPKKPKMSLAK